MHKFFLAKHRRVLISLKFSCVFFAWLVGCCYLFQGHASSNLATKDLKGLRTQLVTAEITEENLDTLLNQANEIRHTRNIEDQKEYFNTSKVIYDRLIKFSQNILKTDPDKSITSSLSTMLIHKSKLENMQGNREKALESVTQSLRIKPTVDGYLYQAQLYRQQSDDHELEKSLERAYSIASTNVEKARVLVRSASYLSGTGARSKKVDFYQQALNLLPANSKKPSTEKIKIEALIGMGNLFQRYSPDSRNITTSKNWFEEAKQSYDKTLLNVNKNSTRRLLIQIYIGLGNMAIDYDLSDRKNYFNEAFSLSQLYNSPAYLQLQILALIGLVRTDENNSESYTKAWQLLEKAGFDTEQRAINQAKLLIGRAQRGVNQSRNEVIPQYEKAIEILNANKGLGYIGDHLKALAFKGLGDIQYINGDKVPYHWYKQALACLNDDSDPYGLSKTKIYIRLAESLNRFSLNYYDFRNFPKYGGKDYCRFIREKKQWFYLQAYDAIDNKDKLKNTPYAQVLLSEVYLGLSKTLDTCFSYGKKDLFLAVIHYSDKINNDSALLLKAEACMGLGKAGYRNEQNSPTDWFKKVLSHLENNRSNKAQRLKANACRLLGELLRVSVEQKKYFFLQALRHLETFSENSDPRLRAQIYLGLAKLGVKREGYCQKVFAIINDNNDSDHWLRSQAERTMRGFSQKRRRRDGSQRFRDKKRRHSGA